MKHTRGNWEVNKWASGIEVCAPDEHYTVAILHDCNNAENNARLIAASPELLDAITEIGNHLVDEYADEIASRDFDTLQSFLDAGLTERDWRSSFAIYMMGFLRRKYEKTTHNVIKKATA